MPEPGTGRRKAMALILSGVFPGLGQFYNHQPIKGVLFLAGGAVLSWLLGRAAPTTLPTLPARLEARLVVLFFALLALWLWALIDAWRGAGGSRPRGNTASIP